MNEIETKLWDALNRVVDESFSVEYNYFGQHATGVISRVSELEGYGLLRDISCFCISYKTGDEINPTYSGEIMAILENQISFGRYTVDFRIHSTYNDITKELQECNMAIEVDGHEFHEKTKTQASHDKKRDRYLLSMNIPVIRYTGTEVYRNPKTVARDAFNIYFSHYLQRIRSNMKTNAVWFMGKKNG